MKQTYQEALRLFENHTTIIIHRHSNPDGDAIGSQVGLAELLKQNYPQKTVYIVGDAPKRYGFVENSAPQTIADDVYASALAVVLDSATAELVSDKRFQTAGATLRFDHHIFVAPFCDEEVVDTSFESCCGLVADFAYDCGWQMPQGAAKALFTGMVTDSGRFRYDSTTPQTLRLAARLLETGFDLNDVYSPLYADDFSMIKLRASFVLEVRFTLHNVAYIYTDKARAARLADEYGVDSFTISRGMVGVMSDIRGVDSWVNFTETENGVQCELRSKRHNINKIAVKYGGGGHLKASGATVADRQTAMAMLADMDAQIAEEI